MNHQLELLRKSVIDKVAFSPSIKELALAFNTEIARINYGYLFDWLGRPIIQLPQDIVAIQELVWRIKPDLIVETGIAHGGSLVMSASMLALLDFCETDQSDKSRKAKELPRRVLGVDIDIRSHNREAIESHPLSSYISMIEGSSIAPEVIKQVVDFARPYERVMVILDSNHSHGHVLSELEAYAFLTSIGSYCVVFDTLVEDLPGDMFTDRPWGRGNSPKTAVVDFLKNHPQFEVDSSIQHRLILTAAPDGWLKRSY